jgi:hypothetical protein
MPCWTRSIGGADTLCPASLRHAVGARSIDDFAFTQRTGAYGTLLFDQERRCPIDLLPV